MSQEAFADPRVIDGRLVGANFLARKDVRKIFSILDGSGEEARIVGGAPRDALIGAPIGDIDFATTAVPGAVAARAEAAGLRVVPTGIEHGAVTLLVAGRPFEVTTLREDVATDGRRAVVRFGRSFERDAMRRDFTVNALFVAADGRLFDYVGGLADLAIRKIRFIGDARTRIREDYLRSLRFLRFHAQLGAGEPDRQALAAIIAEREGLDRLSRERIRAELFKLLAAAGSPTVAELMCDWGLTGQLLGGVANPLRLSALKTIEDEAGRAPDPLLRLAALAMQIEEDAQRLRERLRLSNKETDRLTQAARALVDLHGREAPPAQTELTSMLYRGGRRACLDALALAGAETVAATRADWRAAYDFVRDAETPQAPFSGEDLIARGVPPGRQIGVILKVLQARWIRAGFPRDPVSIARLIDEATQAARAKPRENR